METTPTGNLSNSNSRKPTRELKHSTLGLSGDARYLLVSDGASRGVLPVHLCCGHLSTGRGSRVTAESNPVVCWHTRPLPRASQKAVSVRVSRVVISAGRHPTSLHPEHTLRHRFHSSFFKTRSCHCSAEDLPPLQ